MIDGRADLVVCDGAPDVTGLHDIDEYIQVGFSFTFLKPHGLGLLGSAPPGCTQHQHSCASLWWHFCRQDFQRERRELALQVRAEYVSRHSRRSCNF